MMASNILHFQADKLWELAPEKFHLTRSQAMDGPCWCRPAHGLPPGDWTMSYQQPIILFVLNILYESIIMVQSLTRLSLVVDPIIGQLDWGIYIMLLISY